MKMFMINNTLPEFVEKYFVRHRTVVDRMGAFLGVDNKNNGLFKLK